MICDATPDISHVEQNVILLRYIEKKENNHWEIIERFLQFKAYNGKTGREIPEIILKTGGASHCYFRLPGTMI